MKSFLYPICLAGFVLSCSSEQATDETNSSEPQQNTEVTKPVEKPVIENSFILESGSVGIFRIGQKFPELPEALKNRKTKVEISGPDGKPAERLQHVVFNSLEDVVEITMQKNDAVAEEDLLITDMRVISDYYETKDGLKVGMTLTELLEKYPDTKLHYLGNSHEICAEVPAYINLRFVFDPADCTKKVSGDKDIHLSKSNFKTETKVSYIRVL